MIVENTKRICFGNSQEDIVKISVWEKEEMAHLYFPDGAIKISDDCIWIKTGTTDILLHFSKNLLDSEPLHKGAKRFLKIVEVKE